MDKDKKPWQKEGETLRGIRDMLGLSQEELAQQAGYKNFQYISALETGRRNPLGRKTSKKLAHGLGVDEEFFKRVIGADAELEVMRLVWRLENVEDIEDKRVLSEAFSTILDVYDESLTAPNLRDHHDHLMRQVDMFKELLEFFKAARNSK